MMKCALFTFLICCSFFCQGMAQSPSPENPALPPEDIEHLKELKEQDPLAFESFLIELFPEEYEDMLPLFWTRERLESIQDSHPFEYLERLNLYFPLEEENSSPTSKIERLKIENPEQYWYLLEHHHPRLFRRKRILRKLNHLARHDFPEFQRKLKKFFPEKEQYWLKKHEKWKELDQLREKNFALYEKKLKEYFPEEAEEILERQRQFQKLQELRHQDFQAYLVQLRKVEPRKAYQTIQNELRRMELLDLQKENPKAFLQKYQEYFPREFRQKQSKKRLLQELMKLKKKNFPLFLKKFKEHFPERYEKIMQKLEKSKTTQNLNVHTPEMVNQNSENEEHK